MEDFLDDEGTVDNTKVKEYLEKNGLADNTFQQEQPNLNDSDDISMTVDTIVPDQSVLLNDTVNTLDEANPFRDDIKLNPDSEIDNYIITQDDLVSVKKPANQKSKSENIPAKPLRNTVKEDITKNPFRNNENEKTDETVYPLDEDVAELEQTTPKPIGKSDRADDILDKIRDRQEPDSDSQRSYTVQVFSTLSEEDAEIWKQKLQNRRVGQAYISEHIIRDQTWYRVRVGDYPTREEAMRVARKLGYAQVWVDRIR
jgi:septal ring-binding cell division protein DamX